MCVKTFTAKCTTTVMHLVCDAMRNASVIVSFYQENDGLARGVVALEALEQVYEGSRPN